MDSRDDFTCKIEISSDKRILVEIDKFSYRENTINFLLGESGIGKTLISKALYGLLDPLEFHIRIDGQPYSKYLNSGRTKAIQRNSFFVFQEPSSHLNPLLPLSKQLREGSIREKHYEKNILKFLWDVKDESYIQSILDVYPKPHRPSGGEKQRILIAMAFKKIYHYLKNYADGSENLFVFDEPSGNLDNYFRNIVLEHLVRWYRKRPFTILIITHDYSMISRMVNTYSDLTGNILFRELSRGPYNRCRLREFSPERYINWVTSERNEHIRPPADRKIILKVNSEYGVFDKKLRIYHHGKPSDLVIARGEMAYLKAPSGIGKTTLAKIIAGLIRADYAAGEIDGYTFDQNTEHSLWTKRLWGRKIGMVFQHADEALNMEARVKQVFEGLPVGKKITTGWLKRELSQIFDFEIDEAFLSKKVKYLSGGQKQRLNLLRSLIPDIDLLILDEPLNGLDFDSTRKVISLIKKKIADGLAVLMISHNEEIFDAMIDRERIYQLKLEEIARK